jgi:hypothetical protein
MTASNTASSYSCVGTTLPSMPALLKKIGADLAQFAVHFRAQSAYLAIHIGLRREMRQRGCQRGVDPGQDRQHLAQDRLDVVHLSFNTGHPCLQIRIARNRGIRIDRRVGHDDPSYWHHLDCQTRMNNA